MRIEPSKGVFSVRLDKQESDFWQGAWIIPELGLILVILWVPFALIRFVYRWLTRRPAVAR